MPPPPGTAATPGAAAEGAPGLAGGEKTLEPGEVEALPGEGECQGSDLFSYLKSLSIYIYLLGAISLAPRLASLYLFTSPYGTFLCDQHMNHF